MNHNKQTVGSTTAIKISSTTHRKVCGLDDGNVFVKIHLLMIERFNELLHLIGVQGHIVQPGLIDPNP